MFQWNREDVLGAVSRLLSVVDCRCVPNLENKVLWVY